MRTIVRRAECALSSAASIMQPGTRSKGDAPPTSAVPERRGMSAQNHCPTCSKAPFPRATASGSRSPSSFLLSRFSETPGSRRARSYGNFRTGPALLPARVRRRVRADHHFAAAGGLRRRPQHHGAADHTRRRRRRRRAVPGSTYESSCVTSLAPLLTRTCTSCGQSPLAKRLKTMMGASRSRGRAMKRRMFCLAGCRDGVAHAAPGSGANDHVRHRRGDRGRGRPFSGRVDSRLHDAGCICFGFPSPSLTTRPAAARRRPPSSSRSVLTTTAIPRTLPTGRRSRSFRIVVRARERVRHLLPWIPPHEESQSSSPASPFAIRPTFTASGDAIDYLSVPPQPAFPGSLILRRIAISGGDCRDGARRSGPVPVDLPDGRRAHRLVDRRDEAVDPDPKTRIETLGQDGNPLVIATCEGILERVEPSPGGDGVFRAANEGRQARSALLRARISSSSTIGRERRRGAIDRAGRLGHGARGRGFAVESSSTMLVGDAGHIL